MPVAVVAADRDSGHALYWNERAEALWGTALVRGRPALARARAHAEDGHAVAHDDLPLSRVVAGAEEARLEYAVERADGGMRWVRDHAFVVRDAEGAVGHCVSLAEDVTELHRDGEALRQAQRLESVGLLAGGVAHDFNNLLTVVLSNCDLALTALSPEHAAYEDVAEVRAAGERAAALTRQLLAFSRKQVLQPRRLDLNAVVRGAERFLDRMLDGIVELRLDLAEWLPPVLADAGQLEQVLMNLVVNARDAMPEGGVVVVETADVELAEGDIAGLTAGAYVVLTVRDSGLGMDATTAARVFEPFFTTKHVGEGTGLGLATVYGIARQCRGVVTVTTAPGAGAAFRMFLPAAA
jgi:PAS domain S-box-containing protein